MKDLSLKTRYLITGASGFIGQELVFELVRRNYKVTALYRKLPDISIQGVESKVVNYNNVKGIRNIIANTDVIFHLAGDPDPKNSANEPTSNLDYLLTKKIVELAIFPNKKKIIYLSTAKIYGNQNIHKRKFNERDAPDPKDGYSKVKLLSEKLLLQFAGARLLDVVIIRSPLVYGNNAKGNFNLLVNLLQLGIPLPFGSFNQKKDFIYISNLVDALIFCSKRKKAIGKIYNVTDGQSFQMNELFLAICKIKKIRCLIFPFPIILLKFFSFLTFTTKNLSKLTNRFEIDSSKIRKELGWRETFTSYQGLKNTFEGS